MTPRSQPRTGPVSRVSGVSNRQKPALPYDPATASVDGIDKSPGKDPAMTTTATPPVRPVTPIRPRWGGGRVALLVVGAVLAFFGANSLLGGAMALGLSNQQDADGFFNTRSERFATQTYAVAAPTLDVSGTGPDQLYAEELLGEVRIRAESAAGDKPLFVGIGPADQVNAYLAAVNHDRISDLDVGPFDVEYVTHAGGAPATSPQQQTFWVASDAGTGQRDVTWSIDSGDWSAVVMNADGSAGVDADVRAGAALPIVHQIAVISLIAGGAMVLVGLGMVFLAARAGRST